MEHEIMIPMEDIERIDRLIKTPHFHQLTREQFVVSAVRKKLAEIEMMDEWDPT
jgi:hypothetical protein